MMGESSTFTKSNEIFERCGHYSRSQFSSLFFFFCGYTLRISNLGEMNLTNSENSISDFTLNTNQLLLGQHAAMLLRYVYRKHKNVKSTNKMRITSLYLNNNNGDNVFLHLHLHVFEYLELCKKLSSYILKYESDYE